MLCATKKVQIVFTRFNHFDFLKYENSSDPTPQLWTARKFTIKLIQHTNLPTKECILFTFNTDIYANQIQNYTFLNSNHFLEKNILSSDRSERILSRRTVTKSHIDCDFRNSTYFEREFFLIARRDTIYNSEDYYIFPMKSKTAIALAL